MTDIHDIKPLLSTFPINVKLTIAVLLILAIILVIYLLKKRKNNNFNSGIKIDKLSITNTSNSIPELIKKLENLEKNIKAYEFKIFYKKFNKILVEVLEAKGYDNISKKTMNEIRKIILEKEFVHLLQKTYFYNFDDKQLDTTSSRQKNIDELKNLIIIDTNIEFK